MRYLIIIGAVQLILLSAVLIKLLAVDAHLVNTHGVQPASAQTASDSSVNARYPRLSEVQIRSVIRQELAVFADQRLRAVETDSEVLAVDDSIEHKDHSIQPEQLEELEMRVDYLLSDGDFSAADTHEFETSLATLPPELRQKLLNKLAQSMMKSNTDFTR